ncbi:MAG: RluA family pseudouridine synthase [Candidatus Anammoxibacter sp.]
MIQNEITSLTVKHEFNGKRIDKYLVSRFHEYSRSFIQGLISNGDIKVCDRTVKSSYEIKRDDVITLKLPEFTDDDDGIEPENIPLDIIYEDDHILIINKPPNMVVHPARGHARGTLVNAIKYYCNNLSGMNGHLRPGIVHRLDRDTSGVIIVAKTDYSHGAIAKQFESRKVRKRYIAVVEGLVDFDSDVIRLPIGRHQRFREKMAIRYDTGKPATTRYEVVERFKKHTMVYVFPRTGRTHQIRVHMKYIGHPVVADLFYGNNNSALYSDKSENETDESKPLIGRHALHASKIEFDHPVLNKSMVFEAALPADMNNLINGLRNSSV